ncbi:tryptophan 2,3-dioxygenase [Mycobacterium persicum]|uniref:Tryptophan 2,3-dioxygenase n=1 Tax=Mycobacterium persicum TaxID=1487726 RepID=A0AB38UPV9_9MYCO|nr:tryptophan 2,3-dioxygenase family protein [Mycobacterium persicum]VAZ82501.1 Tryptophan 2,3-dioxygenase [Mycobacterium persicum]
MQLKSISSNSNIQIEIQRALGCPAETSSNSPSWSNNSKQVEEAEVSASEFAPASYVAASDHDDGRSTFGTQRSYAEYLQLEKLLSAQRLISDDPTEMLFIVQHQTAELWMKLLLHELKLATTAICADMLQEASRKLTRVKLIIQQLVYSWDLISTIRPIEFSAIRKSLGTASGMHSYLFCAIQYRLGNKDPKIMEQYQDGRAIHHEVADAYVAPSLYAGVIDLLAQRGFTISPSVLSRDQKLPTCCDTSVEAAWLTINQNPNQYGDLFDLGETLVDIEDAMRQWSFRHLTTAERIIGRKKGTGGTSGVAYLRKKLDVVLFPELWHLRTAM